MTSPAARPAPLRTDRDFVLFLVGQATSAVGDSARLVLLPLIVLELTGSGTAMGLVGMLEALPTLVLGLPAGALADRWDRRRMMYRSDFARAALIALVPLSILAGWDTLVVVVAIALPLGILEQTFEAACIPCVPALVGRDRLAAANASLQAFNSAGFVAGPALAGVLARAIGPGDALWLDAGSFLVSAVTLAAIRRRLNDAPRLPDPSRAPTGLAEEVLSGLRYIRSNPPLRTVMLMRALLVFLTAPLITVAIYHFEHDLGQGERIGWVMSAYCGGSILGSVLASLMRSDLLGRAMVAAGVVTGTSLTLLALASTGFAPGLTLAAVVGFAAVTGGAFAVQQIAYQTFCAVVTPDALLGRVTGAARVLTTGLNPLSLLVAGILLDASSGKSVLLGMGALAFVVSLVFAPRVGRRQPAPA